MVTWAACNPLTAGRFLVYCPGILAVRIIFPSRHIRVCGVAHIYLSRCVGRWSSVPRHRNREGSKVGHTVGYQRGRRHWEFKQDRTEKAGRMDSLRSHRSTGQGEQNLNKRNRSSRGSRLIFSKHARKRIQQRGIRRRSVEVVLCYGSCRYRKGARVYLMDKRGRKGAEAALGNEFRQVADHLDIYVVVALDGILITAGHRLCRMRF